MTGSFWVLLLFWGVWLITPVITDGFDAMSRLLIVWGTRGSQKWLSRPLPDDKLPTVSIIVPAHNEVEVIDRCLQSIKAQDYPHDKLEIIVVDDGSTDGTVERIEGHLNGAGAGESVSVDGTLGRTFAGFRLRGQAIRVGRFHGVITLIKNGHHGKAHALNAGIEASTGEIVANVDSDVVLAPGTVRAIATAFRRDPMLGAATGDIEIDWDILEERDSNGRLVLDENGDIRSRRLRRSEMLLAQCQYLEYLSSFRLGRQAQSATGTIYTLAGACSAFRRSVLVRGSLYSNRTVSEDTDLTLDLHQQHVRVGYLPQAKVFLEPVIDWDGMYAQRVRWTRGQLEVCGVHDHMLGKRKYGALGSFALPQMLLLDHTLAFPRLIWTPLFLLFPLFGYSVVTVAQALVAMYLFYALLETLNTLASYALVDEETRWRVEQCGWAVPLMPAYRFVIFHFRFSGFLVTLKEEQQWSMPGPFRGGRRAIETSRLRSAEVLSLLVGWMHTLGIALTFYLRAVMFPLLVTVAFTVYRAIQGGRRG
ncbi:MAG: glycosyltransferase [Coriobacteriia bacterium]